MPRHTRPTRGSPVGTLQPRNPCGDLPCGVSLWRPPFSMRRWPPLCAFWGNPRLKICALSENSRLLCSGLKWRCGWDGRGCSSLRTRQGFPWWLWRSRFHHPSLLVDSIAGESDHAARAPAPTALALLPIRAEHRGADDERTKRKVVVHLLGRVSRVALTSRNRQKSPPKKSACASTIWV